MCDSVNRNAVDSDEDINGERIYTYEEAIDLTGSGWYIYSLTGIVSLAVMGMSLEMFGFAAIVSAACDLQLTDRQKTFLLSVPFIGCFIMAYPWGYISDTRGRINVMLISLWSSFILAAASAFSPNWIVLAVLKLLSTSMCSGVQSIGQTLLGESCSQRLRGPLLIAAATPNLATFGIYSVCGYLILNLKISFDLGFIIFSAWRLLALVMALPLGLSAVMLTFYCESPKFLLNAGRNAEALKFLNEIYKRNGGDVTKYPVTEVVLNEFSSLKLKGVSFLQSLRDQTLPLFKPPLVWETAKLFYLTAVAYTINNGFYSWLPFVSEAFYNSYSNTENGGACDIIGKFYEANVTENCVATIKELTLWTAVAQGVSYMILNLLISLLASKKKIVLIVIMIFQFLCIVFIPVVADRLPSLIMFHGFMSDDLCIPIVFSYYVDSFPTSYRGMASCLAVMIARGSALAGTNLVGNFIVSYCSESFYTWATFMFSGVIVACLLPRDK